MVTTTIAEQDPDPAQGRQIVSQTIEELLQSLLELGICASDVHETSLEGSAGGAAEGYPGGLLGQKVARTVEQLGVLYSQPQAVAGLSIPVEVINHVDQGKNPHTFTRDTIERLSGENMFTNGMLKAITDYRDLLNQQLSEAFPELAGHLQLPPPVANGVDGQHTNGHANGTSNGNGYEHINGIDSHAESNGVKMEE